RSREFLPTTDVPPRQPDRAARQDASLEVLGQGHVQALVGGPTVRRIARFKARVLRLEHRNVDEPACPEPSLAIKEPRAPLILGDAGARVETFNAAVFDAANRSTATEPDSSQLVNKEAAEVFERRRRAELRLRKKGPAVPGPIGSGAELEQLTRIDDQQLSGSKRRNLHSRRNGEAAALGADRVKAVVVAPVKFVRRADPQRARK